MSLKANFAWMLGSKFAFVAITFVIHAVINRSLGPDGRGFLAEMQTWIGFFAVLCCMSMNTAIYHYSNKDKYNFTDGSKFVTVTALSLFYAVLGSMAFWLSVNSLPDTFSSNVIQYSQYIILLLFFTMLSTDLMVFLQAAGHIRYSAFIVTVQSITGLLIVGLAFMFGHINFVFLLIYMLISQMVAVVMVLGGCLKSGFVNRKELFSKSLAWGLIRDGLKQHVATVAGFVYTRINQLIVFHYCGEHDAGIFAVALNLAFSILFLPMTLQAALYPRVIHSSDDYEVTIKTLRLTFYGWGVAVILAIIMAKPVLMIYGGEQFQSAASAFQILMVAVWILPLSSMVAPFYVKKGAFLLASLSAIALGIVSMLLNLFLVPRYRVLGAAIATSLTCFIGFVMVLVFLFYLSRRNPLRMFNPDFSEEIRWLKTRLSEGKK
ncbi:MAG: hypothetical protein CVV42_15875 [Candidatus Riflebacteria bacterium HGW-Riflebacteria-2]|jgi:O-antigen/teichoic acid export membrane protein|nr:MAG: hypothetical protein CVV42_15875 [Candidatus Riflebacteria bacterium HGW-Riflebacteria-2]